jgi:hypothetical protein
MRRRLTAAMWIAFWAFVVCSVLYLGASCAGWTPAEQKAEIARPTIYDDPVSGIGERRKAEETLRARMGGQ